MKKFLIVSFLINCLFGSYIIYQKGGVSYLKAKFGTKTVVTKDNKPYWYYKKYNPWKELKSCYEVLPLHKNDIVFLGNSITFMCQWSELFNNPRIKNRGIGGDNTEGVLVRLYQITKYNPEKIFIEIGSNDLALNTRINDICRNYSKIIEIIKKESPETKIFLQSVLPTFDHTERNNDSINLLNEQVLKLANEKQVNFLNISPSYKDKNGELKRSLSYDGLHLNGKGYLIWKREIESYVNE